MPLTLEAALRLLTIGAAMMLLASLLAGSARAAMKAALAGTILGAICYSLNALRVADPIRSLDRLIDLVSLMTPFWAWWFARLLFDRATGRRLLVMIGLYFIGCWSMAHFAPGLHRAGFVAIHVGSLVLVGDLVYTALSGRGDDLIEQRRVLRLLIPLMVGMQAGGILLYELLFGFGDGTGWIEIGNAALILVVVLATGTGLLFAEPELLAPRPERDVPEPARPALSPQEQVLHDRLMAAIASGYHNTPGLTIDALADHLGSAEHRLRALINRRLGYRNFSTFLNHHRIADAKTVLADRARVDTPILTLAMDLGYNSLATFNRAFRAETGTTPSDFRREAIGQN